MVALVASTVSRGAEAGHGEFERGAHGILGETQCQPMPDRLLSVEPHAEKQCGSGDLGSQAAL
jgi:hypothetical protein